MIAKLVHDTREPLPAGGSGLLPEGAIGQGFVVGKLSLKVGSLAAEARSYLIGSPDFFPGAEYVCLSPALLSLCARTDSPLIINVYVLI